MDNYESIEDFLEEEILNDTRISIEEFLGRSLSIEEVIYKCILRANIRDILDGMDEDDLLYWEDRYCWTN